MSESTPRAPLFSRPAEDSELREYRTLSGWAVAALVLGLLSPLVLLDPLLVLFPLGAAGCAAGSLLVIRQRDDRRGGMLAVLALVLAVFFTSWSFSRSLGIQWWLHGEGRRFGEQWLRLVVEGKRELAHELHLSPISRQAASVSLEAFYANSPGARRQLEEFFERDPMPSLLAAGPGAEIMFLREEEAAAGQEEGTNHVVQQFRIDGGAGPQRVRLVLGRILGRDGVARWKVIDVVDLGE